MKDLLVFGNEVFRTYAFHAILLVFKMILMSVLTGYMRMRKKVFVAPEDTSLMGGVVKYDDPDIERLRRAHHNDLENIPIYLVTGLLFVLINPNETLALALIRLYTVFRVLHTVVYALIVIRQPARTLMFFGGVLCNLTMGVMIIMKVYQ